MLFCAGAGCTSLRSTRRNNTFVPSVTSRSSTSISCVFTWHTTHDAPSIRVDAVTSSSPVTPTYELISERSTKVLRKRALNPRRRRLDTAAQSVTSMHPLGSIFAIRTYVCQFVFNLANPGLEFFGSIGLAGML